MSEYLTISPSGLKLYNKDDAKFEQYKAKQVISDEGKTYTIIDRKNNQVVASNLSKLESESFFYSEVPIDFVYSNFRKSAFINEGTTVGDIIDIVENDKFLKMFVEILFPDYPQIRNNQGKSELAESLFLARTAEVEGKELTIDYDIGFRGGRWFDRETKVSIDQNLTVPGMPMVLCGFSLFEALCCLFGSSYNQKQVEFRKSGLVSAKKVVNNPLNYLFADCFVHEDTTVLDVFRYVEQYTELKYFMAAYSWCSGIDEFHKIAEQPSTDKSDELWFLEVYRHCNVYSKTNHICFDPHFHGIGELTKAEKEYYDTNPDKIAPESSRYSTSWSQINDYTYLPLSLKEDFKITIQNNRGKISSQKEFVMKYKLIDVLDAIYFDISYLGNPSDISQMKDILDQKLTDIRGNYE